VKLTLFVKNNLFRGKLVTKGTDFYFNFEVERTFTFDSGGRGSAFTSQYIE